MNFEQRIPELVGRVERALERFLPPADLPPTRLHEAMHYAVLGGGKRIRPLLVYAAGDAIGVDEALLDAPAAAVEFIHAFSLVHDDLPAMDDSDLRRGRPTAHRAFDEATAILAADALQPLAFETLVSDPALSGHPDVQVRMVRLLAEACGTNGMTGGQAMDIAAETVTPDLAGLEHLFRLKTGRLLRACVLMAAACPPGVELSHEHALELFADRIGLAFQVRDDILDVEGDPATTGKPRGADAGLGKATYPALAGLEAAHARADELLEQGIDALRQFGPEADGLRDLARFVVLRTA